jgi:hypothetical protein
VYHGKKNKILRKEEIQNTTNHVTEQNLNILSVVYM